MNNNGNPVFDVSDATFDRDVLERSYDVPVVVDFWAPWCGPCRMLGPILERLATEAGGTFVLAKLNVDDNQSLAAYYGVQGIPAVKAFRAGEVVDEFVGALPEPQVRAFVERLAPGPAAAERQQATALLAQQQWAAAEAAYRPLAEDDESEEVLLGLAQALLGQGQGCEAQETLAALPDPAAVPALEWLEPLAAYLCDYEEGAGTEQASGPEADYGQAAAHIRAGDFAAALERLLAVLRQDKAYDDGRARQAILGIFALLGDESALTQQYRPQLAAILF